jgi:hypothetical protein
MIWHLQDEIAKHVAPGALSCCTYDPAVAAASGLLLADEAGQGADDALGRGEADGGGCVLSYPVGSGAIVFFSGLLLGLRLARRAGGEGRGWLMGGSERRAEAGRVANWVCHVGEGRWMP